jgi:hypothetical protein
MRAALALFSRHSRLFAGLLVGDAAYWYAELRPWCDAANPDDHRAGWRAMAALLESLGVGFDAIGRQEKKQQASAPPPGLTFLLGKLKSLLSSGAAGGGALKDVSLAVQGYGQLARPLRRLLSETEYLQLCHEVLGFMEQIHLESEAGLQRRWSLELAAAHLAACARLLAALRRPPQHLLFSLEALAVSLVRKFARLPAQYQAFAVAGLRQVFELSEEKEEEEKSDSAADSSTGGLLENIVHQVSVSDPYSFDMDPDPDPNSDPQGFDDQKLKKKLQLKFFLNFFWIKNYNLTIPRPP